MPSTKKGMEMTRTEKITIRLPKSHVDGLDALVAVDDFPSRSEAIREAVRDLVYKRAGFVAKKVTKMGELNRNVARLRTVQSEYLNK